MKDKVTIENEIEKLLQTKGYLDHALCEYIVPVRDKVKALNDDLLWVSDEDLDGFQLFESFYNYLEKILEHITTCMDTLMWVVEEDKEVKK